MEALSLFRRAIGSLLDKFFIAALWILVLTCLLGTWKTASFVGIFSGAILDSAPSSYPWTEKYTNYSLSSIDNIMFYTFVIANMIYFFLTEAIIKASLGKRIMGGRAISIFGNPISITTALGRAIVLGLFMVTSFFARKIFDTNYIVITFLFFIMLDFSVLTKKKSLLDILTLTFYTTFKKRNDSSQTTIVGNENEVTNTSTPKESHPMDTQEYSNTKKYSSATPKRPKTKSNHFYIKLIGLVFLLLCALCSICYIPSRTVTLKQKIEASKSSKSLLKNLEKENISVLIKNPYLTNRGTKDNTEELKEFGPIPEGKFISTYSGKRASSYQYKIYYNSTYKRPITYEVNVPQRDYNGEIIRNEWGEFEYETVEREGYVNVPYQTYKIKKIPFTYSYCLTTIDISNSTSKNNSASRYAELLKGYASKLKAYENWYFSPTQQKREQYRIEYKVWFSELGKILPHRNAISFLTKDQKGVKTIRSVYFANEKAYILDVHSNHNTIDKANYILNTFTTFYMPKYYTYVKKEIATVMFLCILFVTSCILIIILSYNIYQRDTVCNNKNKWAIIFCWYVAILLCINLLCIFFYIYSIYSHKIILNEYWWSYFLILATTTIFINCPSFSFLLFNSKKNFSYDYLCPNCVKRFFTYIGLNKAEYKSVITFIIYPLYIVGNMPFGILILAYIIPVTLITIASAGCRNITKWLSNKEEKDDSTYTSFKDYYLILDLASNATDKDIDYAFNKAMARYNSSMNKQLYNETYKMNIIEAYRVLSSENRLKIEYDREYKIYITQNMNNYHFYDKKLERNIVFLRNELTSSSSSLQKHFRIKNVVFFAIIITTIVYFILAVFLCLENLCVA